MWCLSQDDTKMIPRWYQDDIPRWYWHRGPKRYQEQEIWVLVGAKI